MARIAARLFGAMEFAKGPPAGLVRFLSTRDRFVDFPFQVKFELVIQLLFDMVSPKKSAQPQGEGVNPVLEAHVFRSLPAASHG